MDFANKAILITTANIPCDWYHRPIALLHICRKQIIALKQKIKIGSDKWENE